MYAGFDSSNYTTSLAILTQDVSNKKIMLTVKDGERGLRQSDAVYQHVVNFPKLLEDIDFTDCEAVGVSDRPRNVKNSYMPCFNVGYMTAKAVSQAAGVKLFTTSHQVGHILAVLYGSGKLDLINRDFIAFHLSGGTTEALYVTPDKDSIIKTEIISQSLDLKAGQAVDRTGIMLGMKFPCGKQLDLLSKKSTKEFNPKVTVIDGNCSLSGVENKAAEMVNNGEPAEDTAKFVLTYIAQSVSAMLNGIFERCGELPVVFSGGVSSNSLLRNVINEKFDACFADSEYSLDNAVGTAVFAKLKKEGL